MEFHYDAKRTLKSGHVDGTQYLIDIDVDVEDHSTSIKGHRMESLSGNFVTIIHDDQYLLNIQTAIVNATSTPNIDDMTEFLNSVKAGETFLIDGVDSVLTSITSPYSKTRFGKTEYYSYSFKVRLI